MELLGALIGVGVVAAAPLVPGLRSVAKAVVKGGLAVADATVLVTAVVTEQVSDLVAEVRAERAGETIVEGEAATMAAGDTPTPPGADVSQAEVVDVAGEPTREMAAAAAAEPTPADFTPPQGQQATADDLVRINGIGPKIAVLLQEAGITTFAQLAAAPVEHLRAILAGGGTRYRVADPASWPAQAQELLAAAGQE